MAASKTVLQLSPSHNSVVPRHGVVTLFGYSIQVRVDRGHLLLDDGIGADRRHFRLPRVGHGLRRLVVIGSDGFVSLAALRWLADQKASFVLLERDGQVLTTTGPVRSSDARLRRAQALAHTSGAALRIARELVRQKIAGQASVARYKLLDTKTAETIDRFASELPRAGDIRNIRAIESQAAHAYWSAWRALPVNFPKKDLARVPEHWRSFGTRISPLTGSPRLAVSPACAMMNYLYALLESEASLAARALGLDAAMGIFHVDQPNRDSLACDLMEPVRPRVDSYLLDWITTQPLKREWFFEQQDGNARLMASLTERLSETAPMWARAIAPVAEWVAQALWKSTKKPAPPGPSLPTRLTQRRRSEGRGKEFSLKMTSPSPPPKICLGCGTTTHEGRHCPTCGRRVSAVKLIELAKQGRVVAQSQGSQAKRSASQTRHEAAKRAWRSKPKRRTWPDEKTYMTQIHPRLLSVTISALSVALGVCESYAADIRTGRRRPHPRHWQALAQLAGLQFQDKASTL
jgi:CRISPR-associated endonuclease Cas1